MNGSGLEPVTDGWLPGGGLDDQERLVVEAERVSPPPAAADQESPEGFPEFVGHGVVQDRVDGAEKKIGHKVRLSWEIGSFEH